MEINVSYSLFSINSSVYCLSLNAMYLQLPFYLCERKNYVLQNKYKPLHFSEIKSLRFHDTQLKKMYPSVIRELFPRNILKKLQNICIPITTRSIIVNNKNPFLNVFDN